ncbi:hypothetical protein Q1695_008062 [Nippostrongylus brasiliensis]|nr:hypothetical protein Q1695_008062 [Nippostrongylus brasiliensis]
MLEAVGKMRQSYLPRLTDCTTIGQHSNAPYVHRMIAIDEISLEIDVQLARINPELAREAGETTLAYLTRVREKMPSLPVPLTHRIAYMYEAARFRPQKFELQHLMELRSLLNQFVKIIADAPAVDAATPASPQKGILHHLGQKALSSKKRQSKFGGSDAAVGLAQETAMSVAGVRDPIRNRQYYEERFGLQPKQPVISGGSPSSGNQSAAAVPLRPSGFHQNDHSEGHLTTTAAPSFLPPTTSSQQPLTRIAITPPVPAPASSGGAAKDLGSLVKNTWDDLKELLGFVPTCLNGGTREPGTTCRCPKLFEGALCDKKICLNGGKLEKAKYGPVSWDCKCPTPQYIEGTHCETVKCANNAPLRTESNGSWWCDCSGSTFYSGRFCEEFTAPYAVFAVPLACLLLFALCIAVCQMDLCPRRRRPSRHSRNGIESGASHPPPRSRRRTPAGAPSRNRGTQSTAQRATVTQELLIAEDRALCRRGVAYPQGIVAPYVIRLDTIPHFNPHMIGGVEPMPPAKPMDPPPSYEQAVSAPPAPQPPSYTETADQRGPPPPPPPPPPPQQPPPPNRLPPPPPS